MLFSNLSKEYLIFANLIIALHFNYNRYQSFNPIVVTKILTLWSITRSFVPPLSFNNILSRHRRFIGTIKLTFYIWLSTKLLKKTEGCFKWNLCTFSSFHCTEKCLGYAIDVTTSHNSYSNIVNVLHENELYRNMSWMPLIWDLIFI